MPALPNAAWEAYAWYRSQGMDAASAYISCGYKSRNARHQALRLDVDPNVAFRIQEFRQLALEGNPAPQPPIPPKIKRGTGATSWKAEELVPALHSPTPDTVDPRNLPAPVIPRGRELEEAHAPVDFNALSVGWVRGELFRSIQAAAQDGDHKAAMAGYELMLNSMMVSTKVKRPKETLPASGDQPVSEGAQDAQEVETDDKSKSEVTISVVHQFIGEVADAGRRMSAAKNVTPAVIDGHVDEVDGDG